MFGQETPVTLRLREDLQKALTQLADTVETHGTAAPETAPALDGLMLILHEIGFEGGQLQIVVPVCGECGTRHLKTDVCPLGALTERVAVELGDARSSAGDAFRLAQQIANAVDERRTVCKKPNGEYVVCSEEMRERAKVAGVALEVVAVAVPESKQREVAEGVPA